MIKALAKVTLYQPLYNLLIALAWLVPGHSVGFAIILLTLLVRLALYPLNASMIRSQQALTALQPELERIRSEFKEDQQAQAKATLELYQARKINPFGSCFLLLIQLPILWILYHVFTVGLDTARFDLLYSFTPRPELMQQLFLGINVTKPSILLGVLAGVAQFAQSWQSFGTQLKRSPDGTTNAAAQTQQAMTRQMVFIFPLLTVFLAARFPAALTLYWLTTTLAMVAQQWWMSRSTTALATVPEVSVTVRQK